MIDEQIAGRPILRSLGGEPGRPVKKEVIALLGILHELANVPYSTEQDRESVSFSDEKLTELVIRNRIAGFVCEYRGRDSQDDEIAREAQLQRRLSFARFLEARKLVQDHLAPANIRHAFLKGLVLDGTLYGGRFIRQTSDIDLLVGSKDLRGVVSYLETRGFRPSHERWRDDPIDIYCEYASVVEMINESGVVIEVHRSLDQSGVIFPALKDLPIQESTVAGTTFASLAEPFNSIFIFFHHSRHQWSCLHWVMDLILIAKSLSADPDAQEMLLSQARSLGLEKTVRESLLLAEDLRILAGRADSLAMFKSRFSASCLKYISSDFSELAELKRLEMHIEPDFHFAWQEERLYRLRYWISRFRPGENDYRLAPWVGTNRWLLYPIRPLTVILNLFMRRAVG